MKPNEWEDLIRRHAEWLQARGYAGTTVKARIRQLEDFRRWCACCAPKELEEYSLLTLEDYRLHLHRRRKTLLLT